MIEAQNRGCSLAVDYIGWKQVAGITLHLHACDPFEIYISAHLFGCAVTLIAKASL